MAKKKTSKEKGLDLATKIRADRTKAAGGKDLEFANGSGDVRLYPFDSDREIWEQQELESDNDYALFMKYASSPAGQRTAEQFAKKVNVPLQRIRSKSSLKRWIMRVEKIERWRREVQREELRNHFAAEAKNVYDDFARVSKLVSDSLAIGIDISTIENHLSRAYAIREMVVVKGKLIEQAKDLLGEEFDGAGEVTSSDGNITVTFKTAKKKNDDDERE